MAKTQNNKPSDIYLSSDNTFGFSLEYRLLGTYSDIPFLKICDEVATRCHCSLMFLPDLCKNNDPMRARFHLAHASFDMVGPTDSDRSRFGRKLNILLVQNQSAAFDRDSAIGPQLDIFDMPHLVNGIDEEHCYALNIAGYCLQKWDYYNITCLLYVFADRDKDIPMFMEDFRQKFPYFDVDLTPRIDGQSSSQSTFLDARTAASAKQFLRNIAMYAQQIIAEDLKPKSPLFPQQLIIS